MLYGKNYYSITINFFQVLPQWFCSLQVRFEDSFNIETVYVKEENDAKEGQVRLTVNAVLIHLSYLRFFRILMFICWEDFLYFW